MAPGAASVEQRLAWLEIAGLSLGFDPAGSVVWSSAYDKFLRPDGGREPIRFHVDCALPLSADLEGGGALLFASDDVWAVYTRERYSTFVYPGCSPYRRAIDMDTAGRWAAVHLPHPQERDPFGPLVKPFFSAFLPRHRGLLVHGAAVQVGAKSYLFAGHSGRGKSRMAALLRERGLPTLDEDTTAVRVLDGVAWAFGTPCHAGPRIHSSGGAPLDKVFFLRHGPAGTVQRCPPALAAAQLLESSFLPLYDSLAMAAVLEVADAVVTQARCYDLGYVLDDAIADRLLEL